MNKLNTLYKRTRTGAVQQWAVTASAGIVIVTQGQVDGALQKYTTYCEATNVGRANERDAEAQAYFEAEAKWKKQFKKGYTEDIDAPVTVLKPMQVHKYLDHKKKVTFPCDVSPKLDGSNGEFRYLEEGSRYLSRGGEDYPTPHINAVDELVTVCADLETDSLNYEIYSHGEWLQDIQSAVKKPTGEMSELWPDLGYHIFDLPELDLPWSERKKVIEDYMLTDAYKEFCYVEFVPIFRVNSHEEIDKFFREFEDAGYEGLMVRMDEGEYEYNSRSYSVLKYKVPLSEEFLVLSYEIDKSNQPVFWCQSKGGKFKAKPKGNKAKREEIRLDADNWIGKYMTCEFERYSKEGKPLKPIGIYLREGYVNDEGEFIPTE